MYIGIDLGGTNIAVGVVTRDCKILTKGSIPTNSERPIEDIVKDMAELSKKLVIGLEMNLSEIEAIGIGCPGTIDFESGTVIYSNNIKIENFKLADELKKYIDIPIKIDNDANCAAMGEYIANGGNTDCFLLITLGTGVGSGLIVNGNIYRGSNNVAVEAGHMTLISGGEKCTCGKSGCWEVYASVTGLISQTKRAIANSPDSIMADIVKKEGCITGRTAFDAAKQGDQVALAVVKQYARYVADGIVSMENIFQPDIIAIGGGISREGECLLQPIEEYVNETGYNKYMKKTKIVTAKLFNDAGIIGAAGIAMNKNTSIL